MKVLLPGLLDSYTGGVREADLEGGTLGWVLAAMDARWPGVRFRLVDEQDRLRPHINVFVNEERVRDLARSLSRGDRVMIVGALSGG